MDDESSVSMTPMVDFWGVELTGKCKTVVWPNSEKMMDPDVMIRLELRQACLGARAKPGERNVVELTADNENEEKVTHSIVSLTVGATEQCPLLMEVYPPVKFHLASGSGPVHIVGNVQTELGDDLTDEEEEEEEEEEEDVHREIMNSRKRSADFPMGHEAKTRKIAKENGAKLIDDEEEEEEDDEEEEEQDSEEESDENESDNEDNIPPLKPSSVKKSKPKSPQKTGMKAMSKTPQPVKGSKALGGKMSFSAPNTPEQNKMAKKGGKSSLSIEDMKEKLKKTQNLPKKLDKFSNYVQQNFKVTDDKVKKQLWEFTQKIRATK